MGLSIPFRFSMPRKSAPSSLRPISRVELVRLQRSIKGCIEEVERLKREADINSRSVLAMRAEINHLRTVIRST